MYKLIKYTGFSCVLSIFAFCNQPAHTSDSTVKTGQSTVVDKTSHGHQLALHLGEQWIWTIAIDPTWAGMSEAEFEFNKKKGLAGEYEYSATGHSRLIAFNNNLTNFVAEVGIYNPKDNGKYQEIRKSRQDKKRALYKNNKLVEKIEDRVEMVRLGDLALERYSLSIFFRAIGHIKPYTMFIDYYEGQLTEGEYIMINLLSKDKVDCALANQVAMGSTFQQQ